MSFLATFILWLFIPIILFAQTIILLLPFPSQDRYRISRGYGVDSHINKDFYALDFADPQKNPANIYGKTVTATAPGIISRVNTTDKYGSGYGYNVEISHGNNLYSRYAHLSKVASLRVNQTMFAGDTIGFIGNTGYVEPSPTMANPYNGTHLHFVMYTDKSLYDYQKNKTSYGKFAYKPEPISGCINLDQKVEKVLPDGTCHEQKIVTPPSSQPNEQVRVWPEITTPTKLPLATVKERYFHALTAERGKVPYEWSLYYNSSPLPVGLLINKKKGAIEGTPTKAGTYNFVVLVEDGSGSFFSSGLTATKVLSLVVRDKPVIEPSKTIRPSLNIAALEHSIYDLINTERRKNGMTNVEWDDNLAIIARSHSSDMARKNYFTHADQNGCDVSCRLNENGYMHTGASENIYKISFAKSYRNDGSVAEYRTLENIATTAISGWMNSEGHRKNILSIDWKKTGVGAAISSNDVIYITQDFSVPKQKVVMPNYDLAQVARQVFTLINNERTKQGIQALIWDDTLAQLSQALAAAYSRNDQEATSCDVKCWFVKYGFEYGHKAQNICNKLGYKSAYADGTVAEWHTQEGLADDIFQTWIKGEGQRDHVLGDYLKLGVSVVFLDNGALHAVGSFYSP